MQGETSQRDLVLVGAEEASSSARASDTERGLDAVRARTGSGAPDFASTTPSPVAERDVVTGSSRSVDEGRSSVVTVPTASAELPFWSTTLFLARQRSGARFVDLHPSALALGSRLGDILWSWLFLFVQGPRDREPIRGWSITSRTLPRGALFVFSICSNNKVCVVVLAKRTQVEFASRIRGLTATCRSIDRQGPPARCRLDAAYQRKSQIFLALPTKI